MFVPATYRASIAVLGLAATTGSPLHGAALMLLLVAMTTPTLLGVTLLPRLFGLAASASQSSPGSTTTISGPLVSPSPVWNRHSSVPSSASNA